MKKLFQIIGIISLMGISFFYTEKTVSVVKEYDDIMIEIKNNQNKYKKPYKNAIIKNDTIIPGYSGVDVDINKSYSKMKRYGKYNESLIVLKKIKPQVSLKDNLNKYIVSGNKNKKNVSLVFLVNDNDNIDSIINTLDKKEIKGNFFVSNSWLEKNTNLVPIIINEHHILGMTNYKQYEWSRDVIKKIGKQKHEYCYLSKKNNSIFDICRGYVFIPNIIVHENPYDSVINNLVNGSIISFKVNSVDEELPIIINYIKNKGYNIIGLDKLFSE